MFAGVLALLDAYRIDEIALFNGEKHIFSCCKTAKDAVFAIQPVGGNVGDKELAAVGAGTGIGHTEDARSIMFESGIELIFELISGSTSACAGGIAPLDHEIVDDTVKGAAIIIAFSSEKEEVVDSDGGFVGI